MRHAGAGFGGSVVISGGATVLLLVAIAGARRPEHPEVRAAPPWPAPSAVGIGVREAGLALGSSPVVVTRYAVHLDVATAYVNGTPYGGHPGAVVLAPHQEILVSYGPRPPAAGSAGRVPSRYAFPAGT
jgi:hypothetical protein